MEDVIDRVVYRFWGDHGRWEETYPDIETAKKKLSDLKTWDKTTKMYKVTEKWEAC